LSQLVDGNETSKSAVIVYSTRYGNTKKIAESLELGLKEAQIQTACVNSGEVVLDSLSQYDLICVAAPTEWLTAAKPIKEFLENLKRTNLSGKYGFAFDTKLDRPLSGSAANLIEKELRRLGLQIIAPRESATVFLEKGTTSGAWLKEGEEKRFEKIGLQLGDMLLATTKGKEVISA
jgi:flavodoxin